MKNRTTFFVEGVIYKLCHATIYVNRKQQQYCENDSLYTNYQHLFMMLLNIVKSISALDNCSFAYLIACDIVHGMLQTETEAK